MYSKLPYNKVGNSECPRKFNEEDLARLKEEGKLEPLCSKYGILCNDPIFEDKSGFKRLVALEDGKNFKKGLVGGYVDKETSLDIVGDWWIDYSAIVCSSVIENNSLIGNGCIIEYSKISDNTIIDNNCYVKNSKVAGNSVIKETCKIYSSDILANTKVTDKCEINNTVISDDIQVDDYKFEPSQCIVNDNSKIINSKIGNGSSIDKHAYVADSVILDESVICDYAKVIDSKVINAIIEGFENEYYNTFIVSSRLNNVKSLKGSILDMMVLS